jgi:uncharacterized heparinase superfamily protein
LDANAPACDNEPQAPVTCRLSCHPKTKISTMTLHDIQIYLQAHQLDGWLLYDFRGTNPVALHVAGLRRSGSRRWFLVDSRCRRARAG